MPLFPRQLERSESLLFCVMLQEQETLSFIRENLEKSDQLTKGMVQQQNTQPLDYQSFIYSEIQLIH